MIRYKAIAPAHQTDDHGRQVGPPCFNGRTFGVKFDSSVAIFDDLTIPPHIGLSAAEIARRMVSDFGYQVIEIDGDTGKPIEAKAEKPAEAKSRRKTPQPA